MNHIDVTAFHGKVKKSEKWKYRSNFPPSRLIIAALSIMPLPPFKRSGASVSPATISMITWLRFHGNRGLVPSVRLALPDLLYVCARLADMLICVCVCVCVCVCECVFETTYREMQPEDIMRGRCLVQYIMCPKVENQRTHMHTRTHARAHTHTHTHTDTNGVRGRDC